MICCSKGCLRETLNLEKLKKKKKGRKENEKKKKKEKQRRTVKKRNDFRSHSLCK